MQGSHPRGQILFGTDDGNQKNWKLTVHNFYPKDKRDGCSLFAEIHKDNHPCQEFDFVAVGPRYNIILKGAESGKAGSRMTCHRYFDSDKRDATSTRVSFHTDPLDGQIWDFKLDVTTGLHRIVLADDAFGQKGWYLTAQRTYDSDKRDDGSTFLCLCKDMGPGQLWQIKAQK